MAQKPFVLPSGVDFYAGDGTAAGAADPLLVVSDSTNKVGINSQIPTGTLDVNTASASDKGLIIRSSASQTANIFEAQNSSSTSLYVINSAGKVGIGSGLSTPTGTLDVTSVSTAVQTAILRGVSGQSSNVLEVKRFSNGGVGGVTGLFNAFEFAGNSTSLTIRDDGYYPSIAFKALQTVSKATIFAYNGLMIDLPSNENFTIRDSGSNNFFQLTPTYAWMKYPAQSASTLFTSNAQLSAQPNSASVKGAVIRAAVSQSANLLELQNAAGTAIISVDSIGRVSQNIAGSGTNYGNVAFGPSALNSITIANATSNTYNTAIGASAMQNATGCTANTCIGWSAGSNITTGSSNIILGKAAGAAVTTQSYNTIIGDRAGQYATTTITAVGCLALASATTGSDNVGIGFQAANNVTTGSNNVVLGNYSMLSSTTGVMSYNIAIGTNALRANNANYNVGIGEQALRLASGLNASYNTAIGSTAGYTITTGSGNIFLGSSADVATGSGTLNGVIVVGYNAQANQNNQFVIGSSTAKVGKSDGTGEQSISSTTPSGITKLLESRINGTIYNIPLLPVGSTDLQNFTTINIASGITIPSGIPASTTSKLYASGTTLYWNNSPVTGVAAGLNTQIMYNNNGVTAGSSSLTWDGTTLNANLIKVTQSATNEGGQIDLSLPSSGSSLSGTVAIDVYQNKLRIFETTGTNRGAYIDLTAASAGVGSNLLSGGGGGTTTNALTFASGLTYTASTFNGSAAVTIGLPSTTVFGAGTSGWIPSYNSTSGIVISSGKNVYLGTVVAPNTFTNSLLVRGVPSQTTGIFQVQDSASGNMLDVTSAFIYNTALGYTGQGINTPNILTTDIFFKEGIVLRNANGGGIFIGIDGDNDRTSNAIYGNGIYIGSYAGTSSNYAGENIGIGTNALASSLGGSNIAIGYQAGSASIVGYNILIGTNAGSSSNGVSYGIELTTGGTKALSNNDIHIENILFGNSSTKKLSLGTSYESTSSNIGTVDIISSDTATPILTVKGAVSQVGNMFEIRDSSSNILSYIDSDGYYSGISATYSGGITLLSGIPSTTTNKLYANGSTLYFNGSTISGTTINALTFASGLTYTSSTFNGSSAVTIGLPSTTVYGAGTSGWIPYYNSTSGIAISSGQSVYLGTVTSPFAAAKTLVAKAAASQSVNIFEIQNSSGSGLFTIDQSGGVNFAPWSGTSVSPVKYDGANRRLVFTGSGTGASGINLNVLNDSTLSFEATAGQLFSISDGLASGTIFSVNDISGMSSIEVDASGLIKLGEYDGFVGIGTSQTYGQYLGKMEINYPSGNYKGLIVRPSTGGTGNMFEAQSSASGALVVIDASGEIGINNTAPAAMLDIISRAAAVKGIIIKNAASQTANLFEVQNSSAVPILSISPSGAISGAITPTIITSTGGLTLTDVYNGYIIEQTGVVASGTFTIGTVTIPGWNCSIVNIGSGVIISSGSNTMKSPGGLNKSRTQYSTISIYRRGSNDFVLGGDLA